jgi:hypothetical protein
LNYLGYAMADRGENLDEALGMLRNAMRLRPRSGAILDSYGWALFKSGRYEEAATILERAAGLAPNLAEVADHLGDVYWRTGRQEEARRADLIKQIRALELVPRKREARLDPTYTPQLGLLEEMSLAELRERLLIVEEQQLEDEEARRTKIKLEKDEKQTDLAQRAGRLAEMRERAAVEASTRREQTKAAERAAVEATRERVADAQLKVKATLEEKRTQRLRKEAELAAELKRIRIKNQFLEADKDAVERKKWESQLVGEQREIMDRQRLKQEAAQAHLMVYDQETKQRLLNVQREREAPSRADVILLLALEVLDAEQAAGEVVGATGGSEQLGGDR